MNLSIVTVNLNNREGLKKTLNSVLEYKYLGFEYIIIDGKSEDGSIDVIHSYKNIINNQLIESDKGVFEAMNKGINLSSRDYIHFLNSGDTLKSGIKNVLLNSRIEYYSVSTIINGFYKTPNMGKYPIHQGIIMSKETLKMYYFDVNQKIFGDLDLWYRLGYISQNQNQNIICQMTLDGLGTGPEFLYLRIFDKLRLFKKHKKIRDIFSVFKMIYFLAIYKVGGKNLYYNSMNYLFNFSLLRNNVK